MSAPGSEETAARRAFRLRERGGSHESRC
ncbi:hypothetical protein ACTIVE_6307 [Actinomadura verrucosospora]|uniref:Uncharacterized protein n=1 Tax=Actinomadura verrucosospora TaxID=46165 RepID=A0A7D3VWW7_ACTVE|nr:hypothetical protein ACTIVE_6307 [Actinomadura verrucosospora]